MDGNHGELHPKAADYVPAGVPFLMASDLRNGRADTAGCAFISEAQARTLRKGFARPGDVLLSHKATMGRTAILGAIETEYAVLTPQVTYYRVVDPLRLSNRYLKYYFDGPIFQDLFFRWGNKGSTRAYLGIGAQLDLPIVVPPPSVQREIAAILGALDDKIDLNRRMNETLEAMARAIFKSWFVDFDPVRAKMEGRQPVGMDAETAALFPSRMVQSEMGEVPEGWAVKPLDEVATFLNGLALQKYPPRSDDTLPVIKIAEMKNGITARTDRADAGIPSQYLVRDGDVLFSWSGSLAVVVWSGGRGALNQHLFKVSSSAYPRWFYLGWVEHHLPGFQAIAADKATTMGHIQRHHLTQARVVCPSPSLLERASASMGPLPDLRVSRDLESATLARMRDVLLPRLLSGELRIRDAARLVEATA